jgi:hypothetical protein
MKITIYGCSIWGFHALRSAILLVTFGNDDRKDAGIVAARAGRRGIHTAEDNRRYRVRHPCRRLRRAR